MVAANGCAVDTLDCPGGPGSPARSRGRAPEFRHEALMQRNSFSMPDLVPVVIDHPQSARRAEQAIPQRVRIWLGVMRAERAIAIDAMPYSVYADTQRRGSYSMSDEIVPPPARGRRRLFRPGQSGNPAGRARETRQRSPRRFCSMAKPKG